MTAVEEGGSWGRMYQNKKNKIENSEKWMSIRTMHVRLTMLVLFCLYSVSSLLDIYKLGAKRWDGGD